jgi:hypothetical protein
MVAWRLARHALEAFFSAIEAFSFKPFCPKGELVAIAQKPSSQTCNMTIFSSS